MPEPGDLSTEPLANPIINRPYDVPSRHFEIGPTGPTGKIIESRRPSESFIPVAPVRKGRKRGTDRSVQESLTLTHEQVVRNTLIDELRSEIALWRDRGYDGVTATSRKLLEHWADPERENPVLFSQREAAETAIFLAEVSGRRTSYGVVRDWRTRARRGQRRAQRRAAPGGPEDGDRVGQDGRDGDADRLADDQQGDAVRAAALRRRFLVVTPGITIRDRLRVLHPGDPGNYYDLRDLVPPDLRGQLGKAQIVITNYHTFLPRDAQEIKGVASTTRKILDAGPRPTPSRRPSRRWSPACFGDGAWAAGDIERHRRPQRRGSSLLREQANPVDDDVKAGDREDKERNHDARVWFKGIQAVSRLVGVKTVYDLRATPFYLTGSGYKEGFIFPWVVSDFSLMDAIESGIVKVPRIPVDDDAEHDAVTYLDLWGSVGRPGVLPKVNRKRPRRVQLGAARSARSAPCGASTAPTSASSPTGRRSWRTARRAAARVDRGLPQHRRLQAGLRLDRGHGARARRRHGRHLAGQAAAVRQRTTDGVARARPRTILIDSAQLESGEAHEARTSSRLPPQRSRHSRPSSACATPAPTSTTISDEELLREAMNTVGKTGKLGEQVRCVVSVAMLTEGWDANTVTHILGIRAFRSQLLCEQVVGRGLRRRSYAVNEEGCFEPEYADVYGVPFAFIPTDRPVIEPKPPRPSTWCGPSRAERACASPSPTSTGYRLEMPEAGSTSPTTSTSS